MCKTIPYFIVKRVQRYDFLRTQPNNCAKINRIVHKQAAFVQSRYGLYCPTALLLACLLRLSGSPFATPGKATRHFKACHPRHQNKLFW